MPKVRSFLEHSFAILISFKIVSNITSAEIKTKSADVQSKILKELRMVQLWSKNEQSLLLIFFVYIELCGFSLGVHKY